jgi:hypothetical protein
MPTTFSGVQSDACESFVIALILMVLMGMTGLLRMHWIAGCRSGPKHGERCNGYAESLRR